MGNYGRTTEMIDSLKAEKRKLKSAKEEINMRLAEIEVEIGECEGYLEELAQMDGYDSYCQYQENEYCVIY